jgi:lysyl-tRNA synthetase class 2
VPSGFRPTARLDVLRGRARVLSTIRAFFARRGVLEVETPLLGSSCVVEEHLDPIPVSYPGGSGRPEPRFLLTSPEAGMKRLLAAGIGSIYQITRAFRAGEQGRRHNPEFTILEWYRPGFDHLQLMDEVEALVGAVLAEAGGGEPQRFDRVTYQAAFERALDVDPLRATLAELAAVATRAGVPVPGGHAADDRDAWLNLLLAIHVEPELGRDRPTFLTDYPASQAALARVRDSDPPVAERFELYINGLELCNGYHELTCHQEQRRRFEAANRARVAAGRTQLPVDARLLHALESGVPACAGVALGVDRLVMATLGCDSIEEVVAFPFDNA